MTALALVIGRPLGEDERLRTIADQLAGARQAMGRGREERVAPAVWSWLARALQVDSRRSFASAAEAEEALDEAVTAAGFTASPADVQGFMTQYRRDARPAARIQAPPPAPQRIHAMPVPQPRIELATPGPPPPARPAAAPIVARAAAPVVAPAVARSRRRETIVAALLLAVVGGGLAVARASREPAPAFESPRPLVIEVQPEGIEVVVDGQSRGVGPLTLTLEPRSHTIRLRAAGTDRAASQPSGPATAKRLAIRARTQPDASPEANLPADIAPPLVEVMVAPDPVPAPAEAGAETAPAVPPASGDSPAAADPDGSGAVPF